MSYGFIFKNENNETVIDDTSVKPWFLKQAPALSANPVTDTYNRINEYYYNPDTGEGRLLWDSALSPGMSSWTVYEIVYEVPSNYNTFIVYSLPNNNKIFYNCPKPYALQNLSVSSSYISIFAFVPNTVTPGAADIPKAYIFVADPVPTALSTQTGHGVKVLKQTGEITFDSGYRHFQPTAIAQMYVPDPDSYVYTQSYIVPQQQSTIPGNLANPVFLVPGIEFLKVGGIDWEIGTNTALVNTVVYGRSGNTFYLSVPRSRTQTVPSYAPAGYYNQALVGFNNYLVLDGNLLDQGNSTPEIQPSYVLSKNKSGIAEGDTGVVITLNTTAVPNGTIVPYTITGISASDLVVADLTREFIVNNNTSNVYIAAASDSFAENIETATLSLDNGKASISFTISNSISYSLSSYMTPEEGQSIAVTLTTGGLLDGSTVPYTITGITADDLTVGSINGNFTISSNTSTLEFRFAKDIPYEEETMRISVNSGKTFLDIPITNVPYGNEVLSISPTSVSANQIANVTITGGQANTGFEFITLNQGIDPVYAWNNRWKPEYASLVGSAYFDENGEYYNSPLGSGFGIGNKTLWIFTTATKNFRSANITVTPELTFSITGSDGTKGPVTLNEGQIGYFKVTTTNVPNGTVVYPKAVSPNTATSADIINSAESGLTINNNVGNFTIQMVADNTTESDPNLNPSGQEFFTLVVDYPNGTRKDTYGTVYINDTSLTTPSYNLSRSAASVNEGSAVTFTFTTNQTGVRYWTLTGMDFADIWYVNYWVDYGEGAYWENQGQINSGTIYPGGQVQIYFTADQMTEGAQTAYFSVRDGGITGFPLVSSSVVINDTSVYPAAGTPSGNPYCIGFDKYQAYHNGSGGTYSTLIEINSAFCGFTIYNESLSITSDANGNYIVPLNGYMSIVISGGAPNTVFNYAITNNGDPQPTSFPGSATLDVDGYWSNYITGATAQGGQTIGDKRLWVKFAYNQHVRSARFQVVYDSGTLSGGQYCIGYTLTQNYNDGAGGTYSQAVQYNSPTCNYVQQYYPYMSQGSYSYYNVDYVHQLWYIYDAKPNSTVKFTIVAGPNYVGANASITVDGNGYGSYDIGNLPYTAGTYTINATFPGNDASYPTNYRTLVFYWIVYAGSGGGGGGY